MNASTTNRPHTVCAIVTNKKGMNKGLTRTPGDLQLEDWRSDSRLHCVLGQDTEHQIAPDGASSLCECDLVSVSDGQVHISV